MLGKVCVARLTARHCRSAATALDPPSRAPAMVEDELGDASLRIPCATPELRLSSGPQP